MVENSIEHWLCRSTFWNWTLSWNTDAKTPPDLTYCMEETCLLWAPCLLLIILTTGSVCRCRRERSRTILGVGNLMYQLTCLALIAVNIVELANNFWTPKPFQLVPIDWLSPCIKILTFAYLTVGVLWNSEHVHSSGQIFIFSLAYVIYSLINFRTIILSIFASGHIYYIELDHVLFICRTISTMLAVLLVVASSLSQPPPPTSALSDKDRGLIPLRWASFPSRLTFWWLNSFIWLGYRRPLVQNDLYRLEEKNQTKNILKHFRRHLERWQKKPSSSKKIKNGYQCLEEEGSERQQQQFGPKLGLGWLIIHSHWPLGLLTVALKLVSAMMAFVSPVVLDNLITFMSNDQEPYWHGIFYSILMLLASMFESIISNQYEYWVSVLVLRVRISITSIIYEKSLRMSNQARSQYSSGEIQNIMSVDAQRITDFVVSFNMIWACPFQIAMSFYLLWQQVQLASMAGLGFMLLLIPVNGFAMKKIRTYQVRVMRQKDRRTKLMNELLNGIKVLKLYAWEKPFRRMVDLLRDQECRQLYLTALFSGFISFAFMAAPFLVGLLTFAAYVLMGHTLDPNKAFVSLSLFGLIRVPLGLLPMLLTSGVQCFVSLSRVNRYLNSEEQDLEAVTHLPDQKFPIRIRDGTFTWRRDTGPATLTNINLDVARGKLIAVVGKVGSGKSTLLSSILGETDKLTGSINVDGRLAYVPQQAWIQNATLRRNITFTWPYRESKYRRIIKCCCLEPDIQILTNGDQTEIGERGINLSGGQKQRISLARAVYADSDIYLLDDPLSAVDAHVGDRLFKDVIGNKGLLRNKTRILATHRAAILADVDEIIVMDNGCISERGTLDQLVDSQGAFAEFITEYMSEMMDTEDQQASSGGDISDRSSEKTRSFVEKVRPILERSKSRTMDKQRSVKRSDSMAVQTSGGRHLEPPPPPKVPNASGRLIEEERAQTGSVKLSVYLQYFRKIGIEVTLLILVSMIIANGFQIATNLWLSEWSNDGLDPVKMTDVQLRNQRLMVYGLLGGCEILFSISSSIILSLVCIRAAKKLHQDMLYRILLAPMAFFDTTPVGRILNRFTKDIDVADSSLVFNLRMAVMQLFRTIVTFAMISLEAAVILAVILPILILYYLIQRIYIATSRQLKRIESITRSPIYHHFAETVSGLATIKAYGAQEHFINVCHQRLDTNSSSYYFSFVASRWLSVRLEFFGYLIVFVAAMFAVLSRETLTPGLAGLAISYSLSITAVMGMFVRSLTDLETNIVSVERLLEYSQVEIEPGHQQRPVASLTKNWPRKGQIRFEGYSTRYRPGLPLVLCDIQLIIRPKERIGVVGRTGAGKSSLTLALFRLIEPVSGSIIIDGVDITEPSLFDLRSRLTIIPQDPVLFTGSFRMNLDPFDTFSEEQIWRALELSNLREFVQSLDGGLSYQISEGGENISVGQRQLVCLARALLRKSKVLVLDEATAAVDYETDHLIQQTIRLEFHDSTVLTIAHRLDTVMDYDRILVLDNGKVAEFDSPQLLLQRTESLFHSMAKVAKLI